MINITFLPIDWGRSASLIFYGYSSSLDAVSCPKGLPIHWRLPDAPILCLVTESRLKGKGYRASWGVEERHPRQKLAVEFFQDFLGGFDAMVLGFLENGNAAEVGIGK